MKTKDFKNDGFGWFCVQCDRELNSEPDNSRPPRFMREGEAESKTPSFSNPALARWTDPARTTLTCPRCGITELVSEQPA